MLTQSQSRENPSRMLWTRRVVLSDDGSICLHIEEEVEAPEVVSQIFEPLHLNISTSSHHTYINA